MGQTNILMITCHDLGRHLGCYGVKTVKTDNIDSLAEKGVRFTNFFATAPTCSPSRGSLLTGRYPQSNGLMGLSHEPWSWKFNIGERHLALILKEAGYDTVLVGVQHVTREDPRRLGYNNVLSEKREERKGERLVNVVRKKLQNTKKTDNPFFLKVGFREVHRPFDDSNTYKERGIFIPSFLRDTEAIREDLARFQGMIYLLDSYVGQIMDCLDKSSVARDTLVIFTSDHGIPYIGAKWTLYDPGIAVPLIVYHPKVNLEGGNTFDQLMSNVDFLPTILDLIDVRIPETIEGKSFKDVVTGLRNDSPREYVYAQHTSHALRDNLSRCVRTDRFKLIRYFEPGRSIIFPTDAVPQRVAEHTERPKRHGTRPVVHLFDLKKDPYERDNRVFDQKYAHILKTLSNRLWQWMENVNDPLLMAPLVTPYYKEAMEDYYKFKSSGHN